MSALSTKVLVFTEETYVPAAVNYSFLDVQHGYTSGKNKRRLCILHRGSDGNETLLHVEKSLWLDAQQ